MRRHIGVTAIFLDDDHLLGITGGSHALGDGLVINDQHLLCRRKKLYAGARQAVPRFAVYHIEP